MQGGHDRAEEAGQEEGEEGEEKEEGRCRRDKMMPKQPDNLIPK